MTSKTVMRWLFAINKKCEFLSIYLSGTHFGLSNTTNVNEYIVEACNSNIYEPRKGILHKYVYMRVLVQKKISASLSILFFAKWNKKQEYIYEVNIDFSLRVYLTLNKYLWFSIYILYYMIYDVYNSVHKIVKADLSWLIFFSFFFGLFYNNNMMMLYAFLNGKNSNMKTYSSCNNTPHLYFMVNLLWMKNILTIRTEKMPRKPRK